MPSRTLEILIRLKDKFTAPIRKVSNSFKRMARDAQKSGKEVEQSSNRAAASIRGMGVAAANIRGKLVGFATGVLLVALVKVNTAFQNIRASLETVTGSADNAREAFEGIREFAAETPYSVQQVAEGFIKLKALGLDPSEESLRSFGNTAAAMGKSLDQFIEAVADASTFEFERLKEFGIKARQQADTVSFTFQGVTTTVRKNAEDVTAYLKTLGDIEFAGAMQRQMETIGGAASNLGDSIESLFLAIGDAGFSGALKAFYNTLGDLFRDATQGVSESKEEITGAMNFLVSLFKSAAGSIRVAWNVVQIAIKGSTLAINEAIRGINLALSSVTFGETSKQFKQAADEIAEYGRELAESIEQDAKDIKKGADLLAAAFDEQVETIHQANTDTEAALAERARISMQGNDNLTTEEKKRAKALSSTLKAEERELTRHNKEVKRLKDEAVKIEEEFEQLLAEVRGQTAAAPEDLRIADTLAPINEAIEKIESGDFSGAVEQTREIGDMIRAMSEAGIESDAALQSLTLRVSALAREASQGQIQQELVNTEESQSEIEDLKKQIEDLKTQTVEQPVKIPVEIDSEGLAEKVQAVVAQAQEIAASQPVQIRTGTDETGTVYFSDGTGFQDELRLEADKRGSKL